MKQFLFSRTYNPCLVRLIDQLVFEVAFFLGLPLQFRISNEVRLAVLAEKMQVDRVKDDPALRRVLPDIADVFSGKVTATQDDNVQRRALALQVVADAFGMGIMDDFDSAFAQLIPIGRDIREVIRKESDMMSEPAKNRENWNMRSDPESRSGMGR